MARCHECGQESLVAAQHPGLCEDCHPSLSMKFPALEQAVERLQQDGGSGE